MTEELENQEVENTSMRDALEAAFDEAEETGAPEPLRTEEPVGDTAEAEGRARDERGRFASQSPQEPAEAATATHPAPDAVDGAGAPPVEPGAESEAPLKAPAGWKPTAREAWGSLPAEVQQEVRRRELEIDHKLSESAEVRKIGDRLLEAAAPYQQMIAAEGSDPVTAAANMFQTAAMLRVGSTAEKANLVAHLVRQFGVDVGLLDRALAGGPMPQQQRPQQPQGPMRDPRLDEFFGALEQRQAAKQAEVQQHANAEIAQFGQSHEFLDDVRDSMADLIEMASRRGVDLSLEDAYNQACRADPEISKVLAQREQGQVATQSQQRTAAARRAASSVRGTPPGAPPAGEPGQLSIRDALEAAYNDTGG
jgi:hypothetical protein